MREVCHFLNNEFTKNGYDCLMCELKRIPTNFEKCKECKHYLKSNGGIHFNWGKYSKESE